MDISGICTPLYVYLRFFRLVCYLNRSWYLGNMTLSYIRCMD